MNYERIVIIGGGYAGAMAAARLFKTLGHGHMIALVEPATALTERVRLHETAATGIQRQVSYMDLFRGTGIQHIRARVTHIDSSNRRLSATTSEGCPMSIPYTRLLVATGSTPDLTSVPGVADRAHALAGAKATARLARALDNLAANARVTVCGAGLTGIELTAELADAYPDVRFTLVDSKPLGSDLSRKGARAVARHFDRVGVRFVEGRIRSVEADRVALADGSDISHDLVVWCGAFRASSLAAESGLSVNNKGQVLVDSTFRSSRPAIRAIGDAAVMPSSPTPLRMACATALPMAIHAADVIAAEINGDDIRAEAPFRFTYVLRCVSLGRRNGLVQFVNGRDELKNVVITGRVAAWVKEQIVRYTVRSIRSQLNGRRKKSRPTSAQGNGHDASWNEGSDVRAA